MHAPLHASARQARPLREHATAKCTEKGTFALSQHSAERLFPSSRPGVCPTSSHSSAEALRHKVFRAGGLPETYMEQTISRWTCRGTAVSIPHHCCSESANGR